MRIRCVDLILGLGKVQVGESSWKFEQVFWFPPGESEAPWLGSSHLDLLKIALEWDEWYKGSALAWNAFFLHIQEANKNIF